jgi:hypothetical protein
MKKIKFIFSVFISIFLLAFTSLALSNCTKSGEKKSSDPKPLNISVFLDLSDRLIRNETPPQMARDTQIVGHLVDLFVNKVVNEKIVPCNDHMKVFFYPLPPDKDVNLLASKLDIDLSTMAENPKEKKLALISMRNNFSKSLAQIYESTLKDKKWIGSDIWGFFKKSINDQCIRQGYRNILVILTDGYVYDQGDNIKEGHNYSYILPKTLKDKSSGLIVRNRNLKDIEVLMLEINPYGTKNYDQMESVLSKWLKNMGISKYYISNTDLPTNTQTVIDNFIKPF